MRDSNGGVIWKRLRTKERLQTKRNGTERSLTRSSHAFSQKKTRGLPKSSSFAFSLCRAIFRTYAYYFQETLYRKHEKPLGFKLAYEMSEILSAREIVLQI